MDIIWYPRTTLIVIDSQPTYIWVRNKRKTPQNHALIAKIDQDFVMEQKYILQFNGKAHKYKFQRAESIIFNDKLHGVNI